MKTHDFNLLNSGKFRGNFRWVIFKLILEIDGWTLWNLPLDECCWILLMTSQNWFRYCHYLNQSYLPFSEILCKSPESNLTARTQTVLHDEFENYTLKIIVSSPGGQWVNLKAGNAWMRSQHCSYWCPGAKAPGHQDPQCWLIVLDQFLIEISQLWETIWGNEIILWKI